MKKFFKHLGGAMKRHKVLTASVAVVVLCAAIFSYLGMVVFNRYSVGVKPTESDLEAAKQFKYDRVIIFGVDGAGDYFGKCDTPNFDRIYANGAVTYKAMSQLPTGSAQNWASMLHGVGYNKHGIDNDIAGESRYTDEKYPSIMKVCRNAFPEAELASIVNWSPINYGIVEEGINVYKDDANSHIEEGVKLSSREVDGLVKDLVIDYVAEKDPKIMFIQFDSVDHDGHFHGYGSPEFETGVKLIDGYIGEIYDKYVENGWADSTLFLTISDHGHIRRCGHGGNSATERYVTFAIAGGKGNVVKGTPGKTCVQDVASVTLYALGILQPTSYDSKVPYGMFNTIVK